jgi:hypothetical protein
MMWVIIAVYSLYWIVEAYHDDDLRIIGNIALRSKDMVDRSEVRQRIKYWHIKDWIGHTVLAALVGYLSTGAIGVKLFLYMLTIALLRVLILNILGNLLANRKWNYLGQNKIDKLFVRIPTIYYITCAALLAGSIILLIKL